MDRPTSRSLQSPTHRGHSLAPVSIALLRISLGVIFLGFGLLKFVPGLSPAADLAERTVDALTLGLLPPGMGLVLVATVETVIGLCLVSGRLLGLGLTLLGPVNAGILSPLVLFTEELFVRPSDLPLYAPTLLGQYVLQDIVLLAAGVVVAVATLERRRLSQSTALPAAIRAGHRRAVPSAGRLGRLALLVGLPLLLTLAACGVEAREGGRGAERASRATSVAASTPAAAPAGAVPAGRTVTITSRDFRFAVEPARLAPGTTTFVVRNDGPAPHDFAISGPGVDARTPMLQRGGSASLTVDLAPGSYTYICTVPGHDHLGMRGTITVA